MAGRNRETSPFCRHTDGLLPPLGPLAGINEPGVAMSTKAFRRGRVLPLKMELRRDALALSDTDVDPPTVVKVARVGGPLNLEVMDIDDAGAANEDGVEFRFEDGIWIYNLSTKEFTEPGVYFATIELPDGYRYQAGFELR